MTPNAAVVESLTVSKNMFHRYAGTLNPADFDHQPLPGVNSAAWSFGHLILTERRAITAFHGTLPPLPGGFEERFKTTGLAAGDQAGLSAAAGDWVALFDAHRDALIAAVAAAPAELLASAPAKPSPLYTTLAGLANLMAIHTALHLGQITVIRRSLGYPPVV